MEISNVYLRIRSRICNLEFRAQLWGGDKSALLKEITQGERMNREWKWSRIALGHSSI